MKMIIGGRKVDASDGKILPVQNPANGEQLDLSLIHILTMLRPPHAAHGT